MSADRRLPSVLSGDQAEGCRGGRSGPEGKNAVKETSAGRGTALNFWYTGVHAAIDAGATAPTQQAAQALQLECL
ncbi:hypothetical protein [Noviherbaspirillum sp.]|uniref:hypothetical protein n=1 Tax=Noviherbaspirillum sp. TaxID=1926288 RepID=UPI002FE21906